MFIKGTIDEGHALLLDVTVAGTRGSARVSAVFDSGYSGFLSLPLQIAVTLGLQLVGTATYTLADGTVCKAEPVYEGRILLDTSWRVIPIDTTGLDTALFGVSLPALLQGQVLIDYASRDFSLTLPDSDASDRG